MIDAYEITTCPNCDNYIASTSHIGQEQVLCNINNEGGLQEQVDILPLLTEESYLKAFPEERKPRAFLEFCRAGDFEAVVDLLQAEDDDEDDDGGEDVEMSGKYAQPAEILRYQDPLGAMRSALHLAVAEHKDGVIWLLLLLGSTLSHDHFPPEVIQMAGHLGVARESQEGLPDIRSLKDADGMIAGRCAASDLGNHFDHNLLIIDH